MLIFGVKMIRYIGEAKRHISPGEPILYPFDIEIDELCWACGNKKVSNSRKGICLKCYENFNSLCRTRDRNNYITRLQRKIVNAIDKYGLHLVWGITGKEIYWGGLAALAKEVNISRERARQIRNNLKPIWGISKVDLHSMYKEAKRIKNRG